MDRYMGKTGEPETTARVGQQISVAYRQITLDGFEGFGALPLDAFDGTLLALDWVVGNTHHIWGSAVMVAPGVAITACHVIDEMLAKGLAGDDGGHLLAIGFQKHGIVFWNPQGFVRVGKGDLGLLVLVKSTEAPSLPTEAAFPVNPAAVSWRMPDEGETISLLGFTATALRFEDLATRPAELSLLAGVGRVLDLYPERRDQLLDGPSICVSAKTVNGMSGGGAFDAQGRLIGVISSGFDGADCSFVTLAWPSAFTPLEILWPPSMFSSPVSLHELGTRGVCDIQGLENVAPGTGWDDAPHVMLLRNEDGRRGKPA